ncbi:MAG: hypothetical protein JWQ71_2351 [Pedosphaera sp.]|nr:hypothetical protein [Pedosphaera sp.]
MEGTYNQLVFSAFILTVANGLVGTLRLTLNIPVALSEPKIAPFFIAPY